MRLSFVALAVALSLPACGRSDLDVPGTPAAGHDADDAQTGTAEASIDAATDVTVEHVADAATDLDVEAASEAALDGPEDSAPEADVAVADAADAAGAPDATGAPVCPWGGFAPGVIYAEGSPSSEHPTFVATGDFNRDGHLDFVATDAGQNASVYINRGDGSFAPQVTYAIGAWTNTVVTGDFNGDGWLDIAAANGLPPCGRTCCGNTCNATLAVLINRGDGTFLPGAFYDPGGSFASGLAVGDMNGDHRLDLVATNYNSNTFAVILGHGDGTFGAPATYPVTYPDTLAVADLDGNGALDVIVGLRSLYPSSIETFFNDGTGALTTGATYDYGPIQTDGYYTASSIVAGDFEGKNHMDLVVTDTISGDVIRYPNPGNGVFGTPATFDTPARPGQLVASDFNRDGKLDVATSVYVIPPDGGADDSWALVLLGDGQGGFSSSLTYDDLVPSGITAGDVDGDGYPDLITGNDSWVTVLVSQCGGDSGDAGDAAPRDAGDVACTAAQPLDYANWRPSNSPQDLVDNGDGTITDGNTGLTWMKGPTGETTDGGSPIYATSLATAEAACPCPWRLPQRIELLSIVDYDRYDPALNPLFLAPAADTNIAWTTTPYEASGSAWLVSLIEGEPFGPNAGTGAEVRCVRGATQPPAVRYTLQTSDAGVAEVVDNGSGLAWKEHSEPGLYAWQAAKTRCASPYRLPTISELETLVDSSRANPAIDVAFFGDTVSGNYASATEVGYLYLAGYFWYVDFTSGGANYASSVSAGSQYEVRCVR